MISFGFFETFGVGLLVLGFGYLLARLRFFSILCLPASVLGGVFALLFLAILSYFLHLNFFFDESVKEPFLLAFFVSLALGFDFGKNSSQKLTKNFFIFLGLCVLLMILQNILGITIISLFSKQSELGLIAGSISLCGSFGMGAFWSEVLSASPHDIKNALDISIACASFGVLFGSLLSAPLGAFLIKKYSLEPTRFYQNSSELSIAKHKASYKDFSLFASFKKPAFVLNKELFLSIFSLVLCVVLIFCLKAFLPLPSIALALICGFILKGLCIIFKINIQKEFISRLGQFCLGLFLSLALVGIDLDTLGLLAGTLFAVLLAQLVLMGVFVLFVSFRAFGRSYEGALLSSAQCGLCLGSSGVALASLERLELRFSVSKSAVAIVCLGGVFFIDFINVLIIWLFLSFL